MYSNTSVFVAFSYRRFLFSSIFSAENSSWFASFASDFVGVPRVFAANFAEINDKGESFDKPGTKKFVSESKGGAEESANKSSDETDLFWKKVPKRTFTIQEGKALPGHNPMEYSLTLLSGVQIQRLRRCVRQHV
ncbi:hypothetical protein AVEN_101011-1 [Araneus ventricosus]|uniref:Uncharacterized protein n=1 Tax=Araneus ventricosus TaxID=182803 RepID=A0A4Y2N622_ARAVE|nr:hypothetical protein AVEN_101011-1 [Araneus ventricosus]